MALLCESKAHYRTWTRSWAKPVDSPPGYETQHYTYNIILRHNYCKQTGMGFGRHGHLGERKYGVAAWSFPYRYLTPLVLSRYALIVLRRMENHNTITGTECLRTSSLTSNCRAVLFSRHCSNTQRPQSCCGLLSCKIRL